MIKLKRFLPLKFRFIAFVKKSTLLTVLYRRYRRWDQLRKGRFPDWDMLLQNNQNHSRGESQIVKRVLMATSLGAHAPSLILESTLGVALQQRNSKVDILLCDKILPACLDCEYMKFPTQSMLDAFIKSGPKELCRSCFDPAKKVLEDSNLFLKTYSQHLSNSDFTLAKSLSLEVNFSNIRTFKYQDAHVGEHAYAGTLRFFGRGDLEGVKHGEEVLRRYLEAAILTVISVNRLFDSENYDVMVINHGIYVPHGIVAEVARLRDIRVVTWNPGYRRGCFLFSHQDTYHHTMMTESVDEWKNLQWNDDLEKATMNYLKSRWTGSQDWIWFHDRPFFDVESIEREIGVDFSKPCIGLLTNVIWDAQLHYPANAFSSMMEWVLFTVDYFSRRPELQLLIRVHPAEIHGGVPSKQKVVDEIAARYPTLPANVFIIPPDSQVSTYAAMLKCNSVLIYGTKMGVELSSVGMPIIVSGEAWIRNKGITIDVNSPSDYYEKLNELPIMESMNQEQIKLARKYAFHFFFRRMIPLGIMEATNSWPPYKLSVSSVSELGVGSDLGLDVICKGILNGAPFVYPAELVQPRAN